MTIVKHQGVISLGSIYKRYRWINLPKDAEITEVKLEGDNEKVYYTSETGEIYESDGDFGFECYNFMGNDDVNIKFSNPDEEKQIIFVDVLKNDGDNILVVICKWKRKKK